MERNKKKILKEWKKICEEFWNQKFKELWSGNKKKVKMTGLKHFLK